MGTRKNLTIGVTVNLEHYENLRVEVSGEVDSADDAGELAGFLDEILGRFGRGDPATAGLVDSYRKRVLPVSEPVRVSAGLEGRQTGILPETDGRLIPAPESPEPAVLVPQEDTVPPVPAQTAIPVSSSACEICGCTVTAADQKMSRLFTSRTLCRVCLRKL
jgi:hypothetical protein